MISHWKKRAATFQYITLPQNEVNHTHIHAGLDDFLLSLETLQGDLIHRKDVLPHLPSPVRASPYLMTDGFLLVQTLSILIVLMLGMPPLHKDNAPTHHMTIPLFSQMTPLQQDADLTEGDLYVVRVAGLKWQQYIFL